MTPQDIEEALERVRVRYHDLVDKWVASDGDAGRLGRGALQLAVEAAWRRRGRPIDELELALAEVWQRAAVKGGGGGAAEPP